MRILLPLVASGLLGLAAVGCRSAPPSEGTEPMRIEVLGFPDCPNTAPFRDRVAAAAELVGGFEVVAIDQETLPAGDPRRGYPAPTALLGGRDLFGLTAPVGSGAGCRIYAGGLPGVDEIANRLRASRGR